MQNVSLDRLRQVASLARSVASALDVDTVLRQVVEAVLSLRPRAFCVVRLVDVERGGYRLAAKGGVDDDEADVETVAELIPFGHGVTHVVALQHDPGHRGVLHDAHAPGARLGRVGLHHVVGRGVAVGGSPDRGDRIVHVEGRHQGVRVVGRDHPHVRAHAPLQRHVLAEARERRLVGDHEEVALLVEIARHPHLVLEALEEGDAAEGELDLHPRGELHADAARRLARRAGADRVALEHHHVPGAAPAELVGDAGADGAGPDDHDVGAARKRGAHRDARNRGRVISGVTASKVTATGIPMATASGGHPTILLSMRTPSSSSTMATT